MNLEKIIGLQEVFEDVVSRYVVEKTNLDSKYVGRGATVTECGMAGIVIHSKSQLCYVIMENECIEEARDWLGVPQQCLLKSNRELAEAKPDHEYMAVLKNAGYELLDYYPVEEDPRFVSVLYQRANQSEPFVYAVVQKYIG